MGTVIAKHPVWAVYNEWRTARMNLKYYGCRLRNARILNFWLELVVAVSASSAVGGLWLFQSGSGLDVWKWLGTITAFVAVYRVVAKPAETIQQLEKRTSGFRSLEFDLERLARQIEVTRRYSAELAAQFEAIMDRKKQIILSYEDPSTSQKVLVRCMNEVNRELPVDNFFEPSEG